MTVVRFTARTRLAYVGLDPGAAGLALPAADASARTQASHRGQRYLGNLPEGSRLEPWHGAVQLLRMPGWPSVGRIGAGSTVNRPLPRLRAGQAGNSCAQGAGHVSTIRSRSATYCGKPGICETAIRKRVHACTRQRQMSVQADAGRP